MFERSLLLLVVMAPPTVAQAPNTCFVSLFDGKTLDGWESETDGYAVEDGLLVCREVSPGKLLSEREYDNFILRFEFLLSPGANNGLAIRAPKEGDAAYAGMELQILDNASKKYRELLDYQYHGSLYGVAPALRIAQKPAGQWNSQEVRCIGQRITVVLNDQVILDVNISEVAPHRKTIDGKDHPGLFREKGHIGFLGHGERVAFRNICIKEVEVDRVDSFHAGSIDESITPE